MKSHFKGLLTAALCLHLLPASAQFGGMGIGGGAAPQFTGAMTKLFSNNSAFTAMVETQARMAGESMTITIPGKIAFDSGKSRLDIELSQMKGMPMPPEILAKMKEMGMDKMAMLSRPDKKLSYMIYPGMKSYAEMPMEDPDAAKPESAFKLEKTELGKETVDGHPCVKYKATVSDDKGVKHEFTVSNATDLKDFPVKIEFTEEGTAVTMLMKNVKLAKPDAAQFDPPADFKKYDMAQLQQEMMKKMMEGMGAPGAAK